MGCDAKNKGTFDEILEYLDNYLIFSTLGAGLLGALLVVYEEWSTGVNMTNALIAGAVFAVLTFFGIPALKCMRCDQGNAILMCIIADIGRNVVGVGLDLVEGLADGVTGPLAIGTRAKGFLAAANEGDQEKGLENLGIRAALIAPMPFVGAPIMLGAGIYDLVKNPEKCSGKGVECYFGALTGGSFARKAISWAF